MDQNIQELANKLVQNHVICCVSSLIAGLLKVSSELDSKLFADAFDIDTDELTTLFQRPDYETAACEFIFEADAADLEAIADANGDWQDIVDAIVPKVEEVEDDDGETYYTYGNVSDRFDDEDEAKEAAIDVSIEALRTAVWEITTDYEEVCSNHNLDYEYIDVYEHWIVSPWLARKLAEKGEVVGEVCGLTVWGRCTSGQAISIDGVIEEIAKENA